MSTKNFHTTCKVCSGEVDSFSQNIRFLLFEDRSVEERQSIVLSCGCTVDFPDWKIDVESGICQILNFAGLLYIEFLDVEMILEEEDD